MIRWNPDRQREDRDRRIKHPRDSPHRVAQRQFLRVFVTATVWRDNRPSTIAARSTAHDVGDGERLWRDGRQSQRSAGLAKRVQPVAQVIQHVVAPTINHPRLITV
ncbi:MAG: hypothetical protein U0232_16175 [Thermomicrobiales bacterium]